MSFLKLHNEQTKFIKVLGETFEFKKLDSKQYLELMIIADSNDIKKLPEAVSAIIAKNLVGEELTQAQILETFSFDELVQMSVDLIMAFSEIDELGKQ